MMTAMSARHTRLMLMRHGESRSNAEGWISGDATCGGLTARGRAESFALRDRLVHDNDARPDVVLTSTMARAVETAEILASALAMAIEPVQELSERTPGECEGITHEEYRSRYGRAPWSDWEQPLSPGGESNKEFLVRVGGVLNRLAEEVEGRTAWIVCHGGIIMGTAVLLMKVPIGTAAPRWQNPANTSISEWRRDTDNGSPGSWVLNRYNDYAHIQPWAGMVRTD
jgi:probable phosphoglycerate mutase